MTVAATYTLVPYGAKAVLVRLRANISTAGLSQETITQAARLAKALRSVRDVEEAVGAYDEVLVVARAPADLPALLRHVDRLASTYAAQVPSGHQEEVGLHVLPVHYDGPDLADVASRSRISVPEVIRLHASSTYTARAVGFQPGFAYLGPLPPALHLPRRASPRARVAAGSVAIATDQTAVYPHESPGGWHLLGRVEGHLPHIATGDRVRFEPIVEL